LLLLGAVDPLSLGDSVPCPAEVGVDTALPGHDHVPLGGRVVPTNKDRKRERERVIEGEGEVDQLPGSPKVLLAMDVVVAPL
jgi:hypothetical protein